jgi:NADH dehydrogenase
MNKVLVLGGTGFVGRHVCEQLTRQGIRVTVPTRRAIHAQHIQMLPQVDVLEADINQEGVLEQLLPGHDAVVNLVAVLHGNRKRFDRVHVQLPQRLAQAMKASGVQRLVHISALGASAAASSLYQQTKAAGEAALAAHNLALTVLRPSVIFGAEDKFLNMFARMQAVLPLVPLACASAKFQPVWVGDVAKAVLRSLHDPQTVGKTFEIAGPQVFTLESLVKLAGRLSGNPRTVIGLPLPLGYLQAIVMQSIPGEPLLSTDNIAAMETDNVASGTEGADLQALGITAAAVEPVAALYLDGAGKADPLLKVRLFASKR